MQRPSGARPRWRENSTKVSGVDITVTPPASAREHSPRRRAWAARWTATSEEEHAVSMVMAGPSRPNAYATRPEATLAVLPVPTYPSTSGGMSSRRQTYPWPISPEKTPTLAPRSDPGSIPARSTASQLASRSNRCCGSIASASRGLIPKNSASKSAASCRNPPRWT